MKKGSHKRWGIVSLLVLVFFQQIGAGLYIHNILHKDRERLSHTQHHDSSQEINFACSCVDNFLMPLIETEEPVFEAFRSFNPVTISTATEKIFFTSLSLPALRGPPVFIG